MAQLRWVRSTRRHTAWEAVGTHQDYRISDKGRHRTLHSVRHGGVAGKPFIRRSLIDTVTKCRARAQYLEEFSLEHHKEA